MSLSKNGAVGGAEMHDFDLINDDGEGIPSTPSRRRRPSQS